MVRHLIRQNMSVVITKNELKMKWRLDTSTPDQEFNSCLSYRALKARQGYRRLSEMTQWLKHCLLLQRTVGSVPSTHM